MYEAVFYTPSDFKESNSEQYLSFYLGKLPVYPSMSRLSVVRALLNNEFDIQFKHSKGYDTWNFPQEFEMNTGKEEIDYYFNLIAHTAYLEQLNISKIVHFWKVKSDWNDVVIVGAAIEGWIILHWYTTA
ncbi:hypothetical protein [Deinococcus altitudinis]|uniref:hypothetical protein n=1 Tax=Deinococcus altitudinis TaxID=468914 RepID=UPI0038921EB6